MTLAAFIISLEFVPFFEHSKLTMDSLSHFITVYQQCVSSLFKILHIVCKNHMEFKAFVQSKKSVQFQKIFSHLFDYTSYSLELESVRVDQCVKQIDVSKVINKENMLLRHTSAQNFEVGQLVVVVLEKFFYRWAVKISSTARAFDIIYFHEFLNPWHYLFQHFDVLIYWSQEPSMKLRGGGQKCHDWNAHLIFFHHDWWKFDGIKLFQSSR